MVGAKNNGSKWKMHFREAIFDRLPPKMYIKVLPVYFKLVNPKRRKTRSKFGIAEKGLFTVEDRNQKLYFIDHRRLERYFHEDGIERIKNVMIDKYCHGSCVINEGDIVVEIGANIGEFTIAAAEKAKKIYSFEPDPICIECHKLNTASYKNVSLMEMGASDESGEKTFFLSTDDADSSFITPDKYSKKITINAIRLDEWMKERKLEKINFLKLEAEGAELEVLVGLGDKIKKVDKISVDGGPERLGKPTFSEVASFLEDKGFDTKIIRYHVYAIRKPD